MTTAHLSSARALSFSIFSIALGLAACGDDGGARPDSGPLTLDGAPRDGRISTDGRPATDGPGGTLCTDTCPSSGDMECDDGGPDSLFDICDFGTDCMDCGPRNPADCVPDCEGVDCGSDGCGGTCGACAVGDMCSTFGECITCGCDGIGCGMDPCGMMDCGMCTDPATCYLSQCRMPMCMGRECGRDGAGGQCGDMSGGCASGMGCRDGDCAPCDCGTRECGDDGCGEACGTMMGDCPMGETCDELTGMCAAMHPAACNNTCAYPGDGECDDGRPGSHTDLCEPGTDCADCGMLMAM